MKKIDLHVHSNCSDGTMTPTEVVQHAAETGLSAFALTDHDNTDGLEEALAAAADLALEVIPGIEFSTRYEGRDVHIVGLEPNWKHPVFQERIQIYQTVRSRRNQAMIDKMAHDGIDISSEKMKAAFGDAIWTRAHFARYLAEHGYVAHMRDAFETHVGPGCKYYVPREKITPHEVTALLREFDGIPILAHPMQYQFSDEQLRILLRELAACGLIGIEVYYSTHTEEETAYLANLAREFGLLPSGGSDFHGANKPSIALGSGKNNLSIPYEIIEQLRSKNKGEYL